MQSSVVLAVAHVTFPALCSLHCWHLLASLGPTAHHRTRARRLSASSAAVQGDTAITGGPGPREGPISSRPRLHASAPPLAPPAAPTCGGGRVFRRRPPHPLRPAPSRVLSLCSSFSFSWLLIHPPILSVMICLTPRFHGIRAPGHRNSGSPKRWPDPPGGLQTGTGQWPVRNQGHSRR